jgi:hypothetical protein
VSADAEETLAANKRLYVPARELRVRLAELSLSAPLRQRGRKTQRKRDDELNPKSNIRALI